METIKIKPIISKKINKLPTLNGNLMLSYLAQSYDLTIDNNDNVILVSSVLENKVRMFSFELEDITPKNSDFPKLEKPFTVQILNRNGIDTLLVGDRNDSNDMYTLFDYDTGKCLMGYTTIRADLKQKDSIRYIDSIEPNNTSQKAVSIDDKIYILHSTNTKTSLSVNIFKPETNILKDVYGRVKTYPPAKKWLVPPIFQKGYWLNEYTISDICGHEEKLYLLAQPKYRNKDSSRIAVLEGTDKFRSSIKLRQPNKGYKGENFAINPNDGSFLIFNRNNENAYVCSSNGGIQTKIKLPIHLLDAEFDSKGFLMCYGIDYNKNLIVLDKYQLPK